MALSAHHEERANTVEAPEKETLLRDRPAANPKILERRLSQPAEHVFHYEHVKELFLEPDLIVEEETNPNKKPDDDEKLVDWSKG